MASLLDQVCKMDILQRWAASSEKRSKVAFGLFIVLNKEERHIGRDTRAARSLKILPCAVGVPARGARATMILQDVGSSAEEDGLDLRVEHEHEGATSASDDVGEGSLEEGSGSLVGSDSSEAVDGAAVHLLGAAGVHHESTTDGVEGVGEDTGGDGHELSVGPHGEEGRFLGVSEEDGLARVEHAEVRGTVGDDTGHRDAEASVETLGAVLAEDLLQAVDEAVELTVTTGADISGEAGTGEVERVDDAEGSGTGGTTGGAVADEEHARLLLGVVGVEHLLVIVLEGEVQGLRGEVPDNVGEVASPEGGEALLLVHSSEAVANTVVSVLGGDGLGGILDLEEELDSLNGSDERLGDGRGDSTNEEVRHEALLSLLGG